MWTCERPFPGPHLQRVSLVWYVWGARTPGFKAAPRDSEAGWPKGFRETVPLGVITSVSACLHLAPTLPHFPKERQAGPRAETRKKKEKGALARVAKGLEHQPAHKGSQVQFLIKGTYWVAGSILG